MTRKYEQWLSTFVDSINRYDYYTDFNTVYTKANEVKNEINLLNGLLGSQDIEKDFTVLLTKHPEVLKAIPVILGVRSSTIHCEDENGRVDYRFDTMVQSIDQYIYFMRKIGLFDLLENHIVNNLFDYVIGVQVGLDTNGRKNRGGKQMEELVEKHIIQAGYVLNQTYFKQMYLSKVEKKWGVDLSEISAKGKTKKRWDFVVKTNDTIYLIETNFYTGSGSKLNETARSYKTIALEANKIEGVEFVWITDGAGWKKTQCNLEETYDVLERLYNIKDMIDGMFNDLE